jgi:hypothetical protein
MFEGALGDRRHSPDAFLTRGLLRGKMNFSLCVDRNRSALESNGMLGRERVVCHLFGVQHDMGASSRDLYSSRYL